MFNSRKRNNDPTPWEIYDNDGCFTGDLTCTPSSIRSWETVRYAPRPEYDNNPNPILVWFRKANKNGVRAEDVDLNYAEYEGEDIEHIIHARKVLDRLANIYGKSWVTLSAGYCSVRSRQNTMLRRTGKKGVGNE